MDIEAVDVEIKLNIAELDNGKCGMTNRVSTAPFNLFNAFAETILAEYRMEEGMGEEDDAEEQDDTAGQDNAAE
jgi:hypothetical protein